MAQQCENEIYIIDSLSINGEPLAIEQGSASIENWLGFELEALPAASGPSFSKRKKVTPMIKAKLMFGATTDPEALKAVCCDQIVLTQFSTGKRVRVLRASIAKAGAIGTGVVDVDFLCHTEPQWV